MSSYRNCEHLTSITISECPNITITAFSFAGQLTLQLTMDSIFSLLTESTKTKPSTSYELSAHRKGIF